jgi:DNA-binding CsgD family transcriptional regulator
MLFFNGDGAEAQPLVLEAVELLERLPPGRELALAYGNVCQREMVLEHHAAALDWGGRALELAERLGDAEATAYALVNVGATLGQAERDDAEPTLRRALALALSHELDEQAARAYLHLTHAALRRGRLDAAGEHLEAGLRFCGERGLDAWRLYLLALRARRELALARWDDAAASATAVLEDPRPAPVPRGWALTALGLVRARRGEPGAAEALDEAYALVRETGEPMRVAPVAAARAEAAWLGGEDERVGEVTAAALALTLERGARSPAAELAGWRRRAGLYDDPGSEDVAGPYALWLAGDAAAAARGWRELGHRYEAALALADTGEAGALRRALDELLALDARPAAALVSRRLRVLGARDIPRGPRRRTRENPAGLTPREVEVLRLMTEGLRNAEIAARLIVSTKTVDHHVSRILRKLDVPTRAAAGAAAARLGLT